MEKLTKKQRHEVYKKALDIIENSHIRRRDDTLYVQGLLGICSAISDITRSHNCYSEMDFHYPELWLFRPTENQTQNSKWSGCTYKIRRVILMFCIEMTR